MPEELRDKIRRMPKFVQEAMASSASAEINGKIAEKYNLSDEQLGDMVYVIAHTILKDISLKDFPKTLKETVGLDGAKAKDMALDIAVKKFLPLRKHLVDIENLILSFNYWQI